MLRFDLSPDGSLKSRDLRPGFKNRHPSTVSLTREALAGVKGLRASWTVSTGDVPSPPPQPGVPHFNCSGHREDATRLYPDFVYDGWFNVCRGQGLDDFAREIREAGSRPPDRTGCVWAGSSLTHPNRRKLLSMRVPGMLTVDTKADPSAAIYMADMARWEVLFDIEGNGYSGRLKMLAHSGRPVVVQDRPFWDMSCEHLLPHCVMVRRDMSDLAETLRRLAAAPDEAAASGGALAAAAREHCTRAAALRRIRELVESIAVEQKAEKE